MKHALPAIFLGHGSPLNAIRSNAYSEAWRRIGERIPAPRAVVSVSAHWFVGGTAVTASPSPRTIHDFGGFPEELYRVEYPAPGDPALAARIAELLTPVDVTLDPSWGLDHGTWSVLRHVFPEANVPIVQLSIDATRPAAFHFELGRSLAALRKEGVLLVGSGNVVHNLGRYDWAGSSPGPQPWANRFEAKVRSLVASRDYEALVDYERLGPDAALAIPTAEHYLPLLYVLGSELPGDEVRFPVEGVEGGSISMLAVELSGGRA